MTKDPIKMIKDCRAKGEPFFVIRAKDMCSIAALGAYNTACYLVDANEDQQMETQNLLLEFIDYQGKNPELVRALDLAKPKTEADLRKTHTVILKGSYKDKKGVISQGLKAFGYTWAPRNDLYSEEYIKVGLEKIAGQTMEEAPRIPGIKCNLDAFCSEREKGYCVDEMQLMCSVVPEEYSF